MLIVAFTAALAACGGDSGSGLSSTATTTANLSAPVTASTTAAEANIPFAFPSGVPALGTFGATTVTFTSTAGSPTFNIASGGAVATGNARFGSCIFQVTQSTFLPPSPLAVGQTVTVNPCSLNIATAGSPANGSTSPEVVELVLGLTDSSDIILSVVILPGGEVVVNNVVVGSVPVSVVTGI